MILKLIKLQYPLDKVIFYDTGMEFKAIYNNRDKIKPLLAANNIEFIELHPNKPFIWDMLSRPINTRDGSNKTGYGWCGGPCRWGTTEKNAAIDKYYRQIGGAVVEYIGVAFDERHRINRDRQTRKIKLYPLIEWGMTEADCLNYCYQSGWDWMEDGADLYSLLDRVSCWCCANKNKKELRNIFLHLPQYWEQLKVLQNQIKRPFKNYGSIFELEQMFEKELKIPKQLDIWEGK